ncbi:Lrp/AsnC family transcriptional regulator [Clostridium fermenticellae]|uniref:Lrp/AsnC family transcriptional regulator n=1 Tax=Clostridium fermenticellae TaxID=2068654 RepID=A0A386H432_9CLOT|nr:Lrp/AsnC family transcriptional regulator [Clostridium fermenticellae]AYD40462.1 Lrp/AsnC family transcriptional regulator [Clostridium fermenticellae]
MDSIDLKLIILLQENSRISITDLSKKVNLSRPSVQERITKMVDKGIIEGFTVIVNPKKIGRKIVFFIEISNLNIPHTKFVKIVSEKEAITEIHAVTGQANYIMKASTANIDEMNELLEELMGYGKVVTSIILNSPLRRNILYPGCQKKIAIVKDESKM